jgi:hypothetical protein
MLNAWLRVSLECFREMSNIQLWVSIECTRGSSIGCEPRFMKRRLQDRIPSPPTFVWTCQKKKKKVSNAPAICRTFGFGVEMMKMSNFNFEKNNDLQHLLDSF